MADGSMTCKDRGACICPLLVLITGAFRVFSLGTFLRLFWIFSVKLSTESGFSSGRSISWVWAFEASSHFFNLAGMLGFQVLSTEQMRLEFVVEGLPPTALCLVRRIISEDWALRTQNYPAFVWRTYLRSPPPLFSFFSSLCLLA